MTDKFILEGQSAVPCNDLIAWGTWMQTADRKVARTKIGEAEVSTVFLGLDHAFGGATPLLFETLVFDGPLDGEMQRYSTWDEAQAGHDAMVERINGASEMSNAKDLAQIIRDNPGCVAIVDNDCWSLYKSHPHEQPEFDSFEAEDAWYKENTLASDGEVIPIGEGYGSGCCYGGDILQALAQIVGIKIESV